MKENDHARRCAVCREAGPSLGARLRSLTIQPMTQLERDRAWLAIAAGTRPAASRLARALGRVSGFNRRQPLVGWVAAAAAILLVLAPLRLGWERDALSQAELNAQTVVDQIDVPRDASVFVFKTPDTRLSIIWVIEPGPTESHR